MGATVKAEVGVSIEAEPPLDGALDPQGKKEVQNVTDLFAFLHTNTKVFTIIQVIHANVSFLKEEGSPNGASCDTSMSVMSSPSLR